MYVYSESILFSTVSGVREQINSLRFEITQFVHFSLHPLSVSHIKM